MGWDGIDLSGRDGIPERSGKERGEENDGTWLTGWELPVKLELNPEALKALPVKPDPKPEVKPVPRPVPVRVELEGTLEGGKEHEEFEGDEP